MFKKKNIIFIPPLASELEELKKNYTEGENADNFEVLEVANLAEANQLIPTLGSALILTSAAKTCALMLKSNKQYLKQHRSKVILVTPQEIPDNTINKLMKVGLNDYVQCPTNQKSLQYKCNLLLQAIPTIQLDEAQSSDGPQFHQEEEDIHLGSSQFDQGHIATDEKQRVEKGIVEDVPLGEIKHEEVEDIKLDIIKTTMDNSRTRGTDIKLDFAPIEKQEEQLSGQQKEREQKVEVKSRPSFKLKIEKEQQDSKENKKKDDQSDIKRKQVDRYDINVEQASTEHNKSDQSEDSESENSLVTSTEFTLKIDESEKEKTGKQEHNETNLKKESKDDPLDIDSNELTEKEAKRKRTESEIGSKQSSSDQLTVENEKTKEQKKQLEENEDEIALLKKELELEIEKDEQERKKKKVTGTIGSAEKKVKAEDEDKQEGKRKKEEERLEVQDDEQTKDKKKHEKENFLDYTRKKNKSFDIEKAENHLKKKQHKNEEKQQDYKRKKQISIEESEQEKKKRENNEQEQEKKEKKKQEELTLEIEKNRKEAQAESEEEKEKKRKDQSDLEIGKSEKGFTEKIDLDIMKGEGKVEHLDKRFKSRKHHGELKIDFEKKNRGEGDTIDYSKIKKEYKEMTEALRKLDEQQLERLRKKKKDTLYKDKKIFVPQSKGVEKLIRISNIYLNRDKESEDVTIYVANLLQKEFKARFALLCFNKEEENFNTKYQNFDEFYDRPLGKEEKWERLLLVNEQRWSEIKLPYWQDESFELEDNYFIFPFFQDNVRHGYSVIHLTENIKENQTHLIEVLLESLRGIVIREYLIQTGAEITVSAPTEENREQRQIDSEPIVDDKKTEGNQPEKKKGFFSKMFGGK